MAFLGPVPNMLKDPGPGVKAGETDRTCCAMYILVHRILYTMTKKPMSVDHFKSLFNMSADFTVKNRSIRLSFLNAWGQRVFFPSNKFVSMNAKIWKL